MPRHDYGLINVERTGYDGGQAQEGFEDPYGHRHLLALHVTPARAEDRSEV